MNIVNGTEYVDIKAGQCLQEVHGKLCYWREKQQRWVRVPPAWIEEVRERMIPVAEYAANPHRNYNPCMEIPKPHILATTINRRFMDAFMDVEKTQRKYNTQMLNTDYSQLEARVMSTFTPAELEEKINPTPAPVVTSPYMDVKKLEAQNEDAAYRVIQIAKTASLQEFRINTGEAPLLVPEKYQKRLQDILRDMRKDQEAILTDTSNKLAKVTKALG